VSADGDSHLDGLWDAAASVVFNAYNAYGWVLPAALLSLLFLGALVLFCWLLDDLPFDLQVIKGPRWIFRWTRAGWRKRKRERALLD
jgi:hypothetical protein